MRQILLYVGVMNPVDAGGAVMVLAREVAGSVVAGSAGEIAVIVPIEIGVHTRPFTECAT
jgi:hypothetical protein